MTSEDATSDGRQSVRIPAELARAAAFRASLRRFLARTAEVSSAAGLTPQRYDLLLMIKSSVGESSTATELGKRLSLRQTAVAELLNRAEEAGLVQRSASPFDRRVSVVTLTPEGDRRLMRAFVGLRGDRSQLAATMEQAGADFRALVAVTESLGS